MERTIAMSDEYNPLTDERLYYFEPEEVVVKNFESSGYILDIGGGGEGIIGKLKGEKVIAIDLSESELEGSAPGPMKIIMDSRELKFLDASFSVVTAFFSLMYIKSFEHNQVFQEVYRVLKPGGRFKIWDAIVPHRLDEERDVAVFPLTVEVFNEKISTHYATLWPDVILDMNHYETVAQDVGFEIISQREQQRVLYLDLQKN
jgi:ubiquinone/menaquinone biosynthesis C-methylase UbiE